MKLLMVFVDSDHEDDVKRSLDEASVPGCTEFPSVFGKGVTGRKMGTRAFPGSSTLFLTAVDRAEVASLVRGLEHLKNERFTEEALKVYALDTEELL
jgi:hypothetical protein